MQPGSSTSGRGGAARQESLREHNLGLVARTILTSADRPSRADVASATGLTRATVSRLVEELIDARLVSECSPMVAGRAGRPAIPLTAASRTIAGLGLEVNIDYLGGRVVDLTGDVLAETEVAGNFRAAEPRDVLGQLGALGRSLAQEVTASGVRLAGTGLALPGLVDQTSGTLHRAPNLGWSELVPADLLGGVPGGVFLLGNEARLAALAELGAGDRGASFLYLSGDVGVGAAIVRDGELFSGEHGWSGELGHVAVDPAGPLCRCGATGCLETYAGKDALLQAAGLDVSLPVAALVEALEAGDGAARAAVDRAAVALGTAVGGFINLVDISDVVLGNTLGPLTPHLRSRLEEELNRRVLASPWAPPTVRAARVGERPAMTGAARSVLARVLADPSAWLSALRPHVVQ